MTKFVTKNEEFEYCSKCGKVVYKDEDHLEGECREVFCNESCALGYYEVIKVEGEWS